MGIGYIVFIVLVLGLLLLATSVWIISQYEREVAFRFGRVLGAVRGPGLTVIAPIADRLRKVNMQVATMPIRRRRATGFFEAGPGRRGHGQATRGAAAAPAANRRRRRGGEELCPHRPVAPGATSAGGRRRPGRRRMSANTRIRHYWPPQQQPRVQLTLCTSPKF